MDKIHIRDRHCDYFIYPDNPKVVICLKNYHNKWYRGKAKCSDEDTFNLEIGKALAQLRCDEKILRARNKEELQMQKQLELDEKRLQESKERLEKIKKSIDRFSTHMWNTIAYLDDKLLADDPDEDVDYVTIKVSVK